VRCRPLNNSEKAQRSYSVVDTPNSREITVKEKPQSSMTKTFQFDKVFGVKSKQIDVYRSVVEPLIGQVMSGYNCTVFAYGQTGTGKTFTMEGGDGRDDPNMTWENDPTSGIIPRSLAQLFDELRVQQEAEFSVRVSFLELYNEEIFDLLSATDDTTRLRLYEDSTRKGSVIIQGLEEVQVHSKKEVYQILERGSEKRQTAATLMNAHSSRSHTVFTVTVHMKESSVEGEEVLRIGKLNLVDLAGSENVGRSGAIDKRAREAGNINQSLLTLGRVITCLVERTPHIPYRESKLTRLLQDSLGGRTKTSIIATVSPAGINLEETLSTLDYAHRAKNIQNKPEVNQKLSKKAVLKEYTEEIEKLRKDLMASREKNGVFLANENYQDMINQIEIQSQEITEKIGAIKGLKEEMDKKELMYEEVSGELEEKTIELESITTKLTETEHNLSCTRTVLHKTAVEREEQKHLVEKHFETEVKLKEQANKLLEVSEVSTKDLRLLHDKLDRKKNIETDNKEAKGDFKENFNDAVTELKNCAKYFGEGHKSDCSQLQTQLGDELKMRVDQLDRLSNYLKEMVTGQDIVMDNLNDMSEDISRGEKNYMARQVEQVMKMAEKSKVQGEDFVNKKMGPILLKVSNLLTKQAEELQQLQNSVTVDVDKLVKRVNVFSNEVNDNVDGLKTSIEKYATSNNNRVNMLMAKNLEIQESEKKFKNLLDTLMKSYLEHSQLVANNTELITTSSNDGLKEVKSLVVNSEEVLEKVTTSKTQLISSIESENDRIADFVKTSTVSCTSLNNSVGNEKLTLESTIKTNIEEVNMNIEKFVEDTNNLVEVQTKELNEKENRLKVVVEENKKELTKVGETSSQLVSEIVCNDEKSVSEITKSVQQLDVTATDHMESLTSQLLTEQEMVNTFISDVLKVDKPTGQTPARADRSYPRYLAATSPHERILNRYRSQAEAATVAARLPLDDSDDGDSLISVSTQSLSRQNSTGDFPEDRPNSRSGSQNSSRANSRQNSSSDLTKKSFGSTSDIGSELGDQENQDPNFRRPVVSKGKNKTAGLKKPEAKSRGGILKSNN